MDHDRKDPGSGFPHKVRRRMVSVLLVRLAVFVALAVAAAVVPLLAVERFSDAVDVVVAKLNPFDGGKQVDRTGPVVLQEITALGELKAASGYYSVDVNLRRGEDDNLPDFLTGDKVVYLAKGDVEATVDLSGLDEGRVLVAEDGTSVTVNLPAPKIGKPRLDLDASNFSVKDKGLITKLKGSDLEEEAQKKAVERLMATANANNKLSDDAEESATATLEGLLRELGYKRIKVTFDNSPSQGT
jgi:uncharacterized protein YggL (DUF469 family)